MADVDAADGGDEAGRTDAVRRLRGDDRGQLLIVTGLAIAVILVALVLLMNTVIYSENLATRGADVGGHDAVTFRNVAASGAAEVVVTENAADYDSKAESAANVTAGLERHARLLERGYFERATLAEVTNLTIANGTVLRHRNASRRFTSGGASKSANWTVATAVADDELRRFRFDVDRDDLHPSRSGAFRVVVDDGDDTWTAYLYRDGGNVTVATLAPGDGAPSVACSLDAERAAVDLTAETIAGKPCSDLAFADGIDDDYVVGYRYGNRTNGTYSLVVNTSGGASVASGNFASPPDSGDTDSPYEAHAVYSAAFDVRYETPRLTYATSVRVAPGEDAASDGGDGGDDDG